MPKSKKLSNSSSSNGIGVHNPNNDEYNVDSCDMDIDDSNVEASTSENDSKKAEKDRRKIRHQYRQLIFKAQTELNEENGSHDPRQHLEEANILFKNVKMTREAALDSHVIYLIAELGKQQAQGLHTNLHTFDPLIFAEKIITYLSGTRPSSCSGCIDIPVESWERLGRAVSHAFKKAPVYKCIFGSFERGEVNLKPRQRQKALKDKDLPSKAVVPREVPRGEKIEHETTTEEVERVLSILQTLYKTLGNICYFEFVTNPHSFAQTVENIFHVAFLIKDGLAEISLDLDKLPVITPVDRSDGINETFSQKRKQVVMSITEQDWKNIVDTFQITSPMIPSRTADTVIRSTTSKNRP